MQLLLNTGTNLLLNKPGLQAVLFHYLLDPMQQETALYNIVLKLLGFITSNLDGLLSLQSNINLQVRKYLRV